MNSGSSISCLLLAILAIIMALTAQYVNREVPEPYMDEVFHIPQVQQYCRHNFSHWDPMITTPPGLYLVSLLIIEPFNWLLGNDQLNLCTPIILRSINILFILGSFLLFNDLLKSLHSQRTFILSFTLSSFPLLFFFSFLYYTDNGSTLTVFFGYWLAKHKHDVPAATVLGVSVLFRQTNIIWSGFVAGTVVLCKIEPIINDRLKKKGSLSSMVQTCLVLIQVTLECLPRLLLLVWPYLLLAIAFIVFVLMNGSIVLGDKNHHVAMLHLPQLLYYSCFVCLFSAGPLLSRWKLLCHHLVKPRYILSFIILSLFGLFSVYHYTYEHSYLLADNRHFTFYIWKDIFRRHVAVKYFLTPVYSLCLLVMTSILRETQSIFWVILYFAACFLALVPQSLLEFRYYIIPYLLFRLHSKPSPLWGITLELLSYSLINYITIWLFLRHPFRWEGHEGLQRFMW